MNFNLLSVAQLCDLGFKCIFGVDDVEIISVDGSNLIFKGFRYENLYLVDFNAREAQLTTCLITKSIMGWLWHKRLGHVGIKQLNKLIKYDLVRGLKDVTFKKDKLCSACQARKQWLVREAINDRGLFTASWFGVREKHYSRLEIYYRLRASEQAEDRRSARAAS